MGWLTWFVMPLHADYGFVEIPCLLILAPAPKQATVIPILQLKMGFSLFEADTLKGLTALSRAVDEQLNSPHKVTTSLVEAKIDCITVVSCFCYFPR